MFDPTLFDSNSSFDSGDLNSYDVALSQTWTDYTHEPNIGYRSVMQFLESAKKAQRYDLLVKWAEPVLISKAFNQSIYLDRTSQLGYVFLFGALSDGFPKNLRPNIARAYLSYSRLLAERRLDPESRDNLNEALHYAIAVDSHTTQEVELIVQKAKFNLPPSTIDLLRQSHPLVWGILNAIGVFVMLWGLPLAIAALLAFVVYPVSWIYSFSQGQVPPAVSALINLSGASLVAIFGVLIVTAIIVWIFAPILGVRKKVLEEDIMRPITVALAGVVWLYFVPTLWYQPTDGKVASQDSLLFVASLVPVMLLLTPIVLWIRSRGKPTHLPAFWVEPPKWREQQRLSHLAGLGALVLGIGLWACIGILIWAQLPTLLGVIYALLFFPILILYPIFKGRAVRMQLIGR